MSLGRIAAALAAVLVAGGAVWQRRRLGVERWLLVAVVVAGLALHASGVLPQLPEVDRVIEDVSRTLGAWTYPIVTVVAFLETAAFTGLVVPGETIVIAGGVVAGQGEIDVVLLIGLVWAAVVLGDTVGYWIGHRLGRGFLERHGRRFGATPERLDAVDGYFDRAGGATIVVGRFVGFGRAVVPFLCGASRMEYGRYIPYAVLGGGLWSVTMCLLGYFFSRSFDAIVGLVGQASFALGLVLATVLVAVFAYRRLRHPEQRAALARRLERAAERPALRPLAAAVRPLWRRVVLPAARIAAPRLRFLGRRLTPGELGLELTTTLAIVLVATYVFVLYAVTLAGDPGLTPADSEVIDLATRLEADPVVAVVKVVTALGSFPFVAGVVLVAATVIAVRGGRLEAVALVLGLGAVYVGVQLAKSGIARPRPPDGLVAVEGDGWPSGHAAYATAYVAIAAAIAAARAGPRAVAGAALVGTAVALAGAIGLSRIYLRVHYWSDVAGGWALGGAVFGLAAALVVVIGHMRQNGGSASPASGGPEAPAPASAAPESRP